MVLSFKPRAVNFHVYCRMITIQVMAHCRVIIPHLVCLYYWKVCNCYSADVFKNQRLSIVINKMDLVCPMTGVDIDSGDEEMSEEIVVAKVQRFIQRICNCPKEDIPKESIIPVYGLWAYRARMLTKEPNSEKRKKLVVQVLSQLNNQPSGQGEDPAKCCGSKPVDQLARELEEISSIRKLERRYERGLFIS